MTAQTKRSGPAPAHPPSERQLAASKRLVHRIIGVASAVAIVGVGVLGPDAPSAFAAEPYVVSHSNEKIVLSGGPITELALNSRVSVTPLNQYGWSDSVTSSSFGNMFGGPSGMGTGALYTYKNGLLGGHGQFLGRGTNAKGGAGTRADPAWISLTGDLDTATTGRAPGEVTVTKKASIVPGDSFARYDVTLTNNSTIPLEMGFWQRGECEFELPTIWKTDGYGKLNPSESVYCLSKDGVRVAGFHAISPGARLGAGNVNAAHQPDFFLVDHCTSDPNNIGGPLDRVPCDLVQRYYSIGIGWPAAVQAPGESRTYSYLAVYGEMEAGPGDDNVNASASASASAKADDQGNAAAQVAAKAAALSDATTTASAAADVSAQVAAQSAATSTASADASKDADGAAEAAAKVAGLADATSNANAAGSTVADANAAAASQAAAT
ncbi:hypothetical protein U746_2500, partial [Mycolicibacterium mucogenicum 261Sha1.1M5]